MDYLSGINQFTQVAAQLSVLLLIVRVAFGALNCFMGYRMLKFWISVCGFFLGTGIGMTAVYILQLSGNVKLDSATGSRGHNCGSGILRCTL